MGTAAPAGTPRRAGLGTAGGAAHESPAEHSPLHVHQNWVAASSYSRAIFQFSCFSREKASIYKHLYRKSLKHIHFIMTAVFANLH